MASLVMEGVSHAFDGVRAVDSVDLRVDEGEILCLLGPSGCGKTTTLRVAAGLEELQEGRVFIGGREVAGPSVSVPAEHRGVGLVFQDYALFPHLDVVGNVAFGIDAASNGARRRRALEMLEQVGLADFATKFPHTLSGGEQQRVALARALAPKPGLMLMDEPFSGLDIRLRDRVRDDTLDVLKKTGTATLLVTHDPEEAMLMADRIALMRDGRIVQQGTPVELYSRPADAFVARFFSEVNAFPGVVQDGLVKTALADMPANGHAEGAKVEVLVRPEAIAVGAEGRVAEVLSARALGAYSLVRLRLGEGGCELTARLAEMPPPRVAEKVAVTLDPARAFVFPAARDE